MTEANSLAFIVLAFSLGLCMGVSILLLLLRARGEQLQRQLADRGLRVTDARGAALSPSELMGLIAASLPATGGIPARRLVLVAAGAAAVAAALVLLL